MYSLHVYKLADYASAPWTTDREEGKGKEKEEATRKRKRKRRPTAFCPALELSTL